ncbi:polyprenyl synthetase family protein [Nocardia brasiliensis]|uniref:polyprenyl synthetase family protein n=1 Tax=Nocardia brasiliensis TaxID=37326 RepID=UPI002456E983|nr:polyprenyl synthetase family protein [Nocardia brasiliensis]
MSIGDTVSASSVTSRKEVQVVAEAQAGVAPLLRAVVQRLPETMWQVCGYHFGWLDAAGLPSDADGGKAIRSGLVLASARAVGGNVADALPAAVAVELAHNFSLLHDDVMDGDHIRRHRPTAWSVFGVPAAVLAGDALLSMAFDVLAAASGGDAAARVLAAAVVELTEGQAADLAFERRTDVQRDEALLMAEQKTGALMSAACMLGAMSAGGSAARIKAFRGFGMQLGVAFQCVDDLLGIWGDPAATGKVVYADLVRRKKSLPVVSAMSSGSMAATELARLYSIERPLSDVELIEAARLIDSAGGRYWTRTQARLRLEEAFIFLDAAELAEPAKADLTALARLITDRDH